MNYTPELVIIASGIQLQIKKRGLETRNELERNCVVCLSVRVFMSPWLKGDLMKFKENYYLFDGFDRSHLE